MIHQLPQELINKIAAGEVVERPSSVVKELVENSIDAGSTEIIIEITEDFIRITDNGEGIEKNDLKKLFVNHSTSKINSIEDLSSIITMGFRGEAIATIASVSKMEIKSHYKDDKNGYVITPETSPHQTAMNYGTVIEVRDLFYNVPARKKFLKSPAVENKYIIDTITRISLANPNINFKLTINDKLIFNLIPGNLEQRIKAVIPNIKLIPIINDDIITGFISVPKDTFSKATYQYVFVNNRFITPSPTISRAVFTGYKNSIMRGQYPPYVIFINVRPEEVDVNIHPRKLEVKFENEGYIFQKIYTSIQHTLFRENNTIFEPTNYNQGFSQNNNIDTPSFTKEFQKPSSHGFIPNYKGQSRDENLNLFKSSASVSNAIDFSSEILKQVYDPFDKVDVGTAQQYMNSYIITQSNDSLVIFDQHACSERFLFEKYKNLYSGKEIKTKKLLIPEVIPNEHYQFLMEKKDVLKSFGIIINNSSDSAIISEIPEFASLKIVDQLYAEIKSIFDTDLSSISELQDKMITTLACHSAIRFGDKLDVKECQKIIVDLLTCTNKLTCPHGRPTYYEIPKDKLREIFKR